MSKRRSVASKTSSARAENASKNGASPAGHVLHRRDGRSLLRGDFRRWACWQGTPRQGEIPTLVELLPIPAPAPRSRGRMPRSRQRAESRQEKIAGCDVFREDRASADPGSPKTASQDVMFFVKTELLPIPAPVPRSRGRMPRSRQRAEARQEKTAGCCVFREDSP